MCLPKYKEFFKWVIIILKNGKFTITTNCELLADAVEGLCRIVYISPIDFDRKYSLIESLKEAKKTTNLAFSLFYCYFFKFNPPFIFFDESDTGKKILNTLSLIDKIQISVFRLPYSSRKLISMQVVVVVIFC